MKGIMPGHTYAKDEPNESNNAASNTQVIVSYAKHLAYFPLGVPGNIFLGLEIYWYVLHRKGLSPIIIHSFQFSASFLGGLNGEVSF